MGIFNLDFFQITHAEFEERGVLIQIQIRVERGDLRGLKLWSPSFSHATLTTSFPSGELHPLGA